MLANKSSGVLLPPANRARAFWRCFIYDVIVILKYQGSYLSSIVKRILILKEMYFSDNDSNTSKTRYLRQLRGREEYFDNQSCGKNLESGVD
jgi:hypothetical protein